MIESCKPYLKTFGITSISCCRSTRASKTGRGTRAVDADVTIPYHPAAVQFYKERGAWPATMDDAQRKLLSFNP